MINSFSGKYKFLSNFYPSEVEYDGVIYPSVEHAYQAAKTLNLGLRLKFAEPCVTAAEAKRMGRKLPIRDHWEVTKSPIMFALLIKKFSISHLKEKLLLTGEEDLKEGNYWHDNIWGSCECNKCGDNGNNTLGKLLVAVRNLMRANDETTS